MKDLIAELQLYALDIVTREGLELEFDKYLLEKEPYYYHSRYAFIDFIIQYTENSREDL